MIKNMRKTFKEALDKHIPKGHQLAKAINQHTCKLSYSSMLSMASKIGSSNNRVKNNNTKIGKKNSAIVQKQKRGNSLNVSLGAPTLGKA